jgi:cobalt-zinc-cadmium efflux system membrane fusion protein
MLPSRQPRFKARLRRLGSRCKHYQRRIQFASVEAIDKAGIDIAVAQESPIVEAISASGEVLYDQTHLARLTSRVTGTMWRVEKQVGAAVRKGDILALVDSAQVGRSKADFLQAISQLRLAETNVERLQPLARDGAVAGKLLREAESALQEAQIKLLGAQQALVNLGLPVAADEFSILNTQGGQVWPGCFLLRRHWGACSLNVEGLRQ